MTANTGFVEGDGFIEFRIPDWPACANRMPAGYSANIELLGDHPSGLWESGDVLVCMRELNTIAVVSLASGQVRWWWGMDELSGPHQPSVLADGRILVFDNGVAKRRTRLVAVEPATREVVWSWSADPPGSFFCQLAGGCQQLPNGNLLVTNSKTGAAFELTMDGRTVWRLTLPVDVYGADRGRVSIYRMSMVPTDLAERLHQPGPAGIPMPRSPHRDIAAVATASDSRGGRS